MRDLNAAVAHAWREPMSDLFIGPVHDTSAYWPAAKDC